MTDDTGVLSSAAARRMLGAISPVYGRATRFLRIFDSLGGQMQQLGDWATELKAQAMPQTATWALALWEDEYSLTGGAAPLQQRRAVLLSKVRARAATNPWAIEQRARAVSGYGARVVEHTGRNRFKVYVQRCMTDEVALRRAIDEIKPAHLVYDIRCEELLPGGVKAVCGVRYARRYGLARLSG